MSYKFNVQHGVAVMNFSEEYCQSRCELLESDSFYKVLRLFIKKQRRTSTTLYRYLHACNSDDTKLAKELRDIFKLLLVLSAEECVASRPDYGCYFQSWDMFHRLVEDLYLYWRRLERYAIVFNDEKRSGYQNVHFASAQNAFEDLVLKVYRSIEETALGKKNNVYRQITAGVNAGLTITNMRVMLPYTYRNLDRIPFIEQVIIHPPFIAYSKRNKRDGIFPEVNYNPIEDLRFDAEQWFCYPAKVGRLLCYVYFNQRYMAQGVSLCNLFELASEEEYRNRVPDLIYVYGYEDYKYNQCFYHDQENNIMVGLVSADDDFDYFGYMKKMILTLHNVHAINHHCLPVHGAMVTMKIHDHGQKNIVIMGDSGAGKSETIEQIKGLGAAYIEEIKTIYDDMGLLSLEDGIVKTSGTEVGAFVRLDDLDAGYSFKELDRSVFMNPDKKNARIIIPITEYKDVVKSHDIDLFLYANNYDEGESLEFFDSLADALKVFRAGQRMAKGTTTEYGLVGSYFANPFGPVQRREQTEPILEEYFTKMMDQGVKIGQLHTKLGIKGNEHTGPKDGAIAILKYLTGDDTLKTLKEEDE